MNRSMSIIIITLLFLTLGLPAQSPIITAPNGGETLILGQTVQITWTANGISQKLKLQLHQGGTVLGIIANNLDAVPSTYTWTVGRYGASTAAAGTNYRIRIVTTDNAKEDFSDRNFSIAAGSSSAPPAPPSSLHIAGTPPASTLLTISKPNGGESWLQGASGHITWNAMGLSGSNRLELWQGNNRIGHIAQNLTSGPGDYAWNIGNLEGGAKATPANNYRIKIINSGGQEDMSNRDFTITPEVRKMRHDPTDPVQINHPNLQQQNNMTNLELVAYAVINSFSVNGRTSSPLNDLIECYRSQGVACQASTFSKTQPVMYRYTLYLESPYNSMRYLIYQGAWIPQSNFTINLQYSGVLDKLFPDGLNGKPVPVAVRGSVWVEAKNTSQTEPPQRRTLEIDFHL